VNKRGNIGTLVASHPGNTNAVKHGAYSPRLTQDRAAEIEASLVEAFTFSASQHVAVREVARLMAILEAIDRDLDERGVVDKKGAPRSLLNHRSRISRQLERWLGQVSSTIDRQSDGPRTGPASQDDFVGELEWIALGHEPEATPRDRILAYRELSKLAPTPTAPQTSVMTIRVIRDDDGNEQMEFVDDDSEDPAES
jgi:hypothetical protein